MIAPNTLLQNRYLVLNQIGQGGMGAVYVATDQRFGSTVALKETFFDEPGLRKAFEREARLLNHLRHPALPRVSDHFAEDEGQFIVMEYIAGDDLAAKLTERNGAFPVSEVLNWADQLLDALDYLHTQEPTIIHRDIKPQNLKLTPRKHIVLLDFGLAKGTLAHQTVGTATKSVFGYSRNYAPLEQIQGAGTDPRSDLYSLAATLYHLMTNVTPPDVLTRATAVLNGQPDPLLPASDVHPQVTPAVAEVISKAMAQNASQRPQTAAAMRELLREAARQGHSVARDTTAPIASPANVYEQDTQLMFAAVPATKTGEAAEETGTVKGEAAATAINSEPAAGASLLMSDADSVVTKVAKAEPTTLKNNSRQRVVAIAASAIILLAVAAAVYTFTNTTPPVQPALNTPTAPATPQPSEAEDQNAADSAETKIEISPVPDASPVVIIRQGTKGKTAKGKQSTTRDDGVEVDEDEMPEPPDPDEPPLPRRRDGTLPRPGDPEFEEGIRQAEEARRAGAEARRAAREQRRLIMQKALERERQRRRQQQQP